MYDRDMAKGINFAFTARRRYNYHDQAYFSEIDHTLNKLTTMYFVSKILAEKEGWKFAKEHGMDFVTIIPTLVVGPFLIPSMPPSLITALSPITRNEEHYSIIKQGSPPSSRIF